MPILNSPETIRRHPLGLSTGQDQGQAALHSPQVALWRVKKTYVKLLMRLNVWSRFCSRKVGNRAHMGKQERLPAFADRE